MKRFVAILFVAGVALAALVVSACGDMSESTPSPDPTVPVVVREVSGNLQPLSQDQCGALSSSLKQLGAPTSVEQAPFLDQITGSRGTGCLVSVTGTGVQFTSPQNVAARVTSMLTAQSWQEDKNYSTSGPSGAATAFRKGAALCLFSVGWWPDGITCPAGRPLTECAVPAEKKMYQIDLQCVQ